jgi:hypothetical protein
MSLPTSQIDTIDILYDTKVNGSVLEGAEWSDNFQKIETKSNEIIASSNSFLTALTNLTNGGFTYEDSDWRNFIKQFFTNGIITTGTSAFQASNTGNDMITSIAVGQIHIDGYVNDFTTTTNLTHATPNSTNPRKDVIVARLNYSTKTITLVLITGTAAAVPSEPVIEQNTSLYDLKLFSILIPANVSSIPETNSETITDYRFIDTVCGFSKVSHVDFLDDENNLFMYDRNVTSVNSYDTPVVVEYSRKEDGTLFIQRTYSNLDSNGQPLLVTEKYYAANGITLYKTITFVLTYLNSGSIDTCVRTVS